MLPRRGDIFLVDFDPARAGEANKIRPAVVITNNSANTHGSSVIVLPISSKTEPMYPFQLLLPVSRTNLEHDSKAQTELLRSVSKNRLVKKLGFVPEDVMTDLDSRIKLHLGLT
jgi:mRNA interferase MazF